MCKNFWPKTSQFVMLNFSPTLKIRWSFGVLCWEIFSLGAVPYGEIKRHRDCIRYIAEGNRLERPRFASDDIWDIIYSCFFEAKERPTMEELRKKFAKMSNYNSPLLKTDKSSEKSQQSADNYNPEDFTETSNYGHIGVEPVKMWSSPVSDDSHKAPKLPSTYALTGPQQEERKSSSYHIMQSPQPKPANEALSGVVYATSH